MGADTFGMLIHTTAAPMAAGREAEGAVASGGGQAPPGAQPERRARLLRGGGPAALRRRVPGDPGVASVGC
eukprot:501694-Pyramimonas_sp.AAC.1